jgi:hypothetical protein
MHRVELHRLINRYKEDFKELRKSKVEVPEHWTDSSD